MALINYIEPTDPGSLFLGIGGLILFCTISYILYRFYIKFCQYFDIGINKEIKYSILEESYLDDIGKKKNINLELELQKRNIIKKERKSIRRKLEEKIYEDMFGKEEKP